MEIRHRALSNDEVRDEFENEKRTNQFELLVSVAPQKQGSITGSTGKTKLMRRSSVKLRKPSLRMKDSSKSKIDRGMTKRFFMFPSI